MKPKVTWCTVVLSLWWASEDIYCTHYVDQFNTVSRQDIVRSPCPPWTVWQTWVLQYQDTQSSNFQFLWWQWWHTNMLLFWPVTSLKVCYNSSCVESAWNVQNNWPGCCAFWAISTSIPMGHRTPVAMRHRTFGATVGAMGHRTHVAMALFTGFFKALKSIVK